MKMKWVERNKLWYRPGEENLEYGHSPREIAEMRARKLLELHLDEQQLQEWEAHRRFRVKVRSRIGIRMWHTVFCDGRQFPVRGPLGDPHCIHAVVHEELPEDDFYLALLLMLRGAPRRYRKIRNVQRMARI